MRTGAVEVVADPAARDGARPDGGARARTPGSGDGGETGTTGTTGTRRCPARATEISIAVNPWTGSAVNANIAKILLEQQLGYTVELVDIDEYAQFPALSTGELDATLEVWPSGHAEDYAHLHRRRRQRRRRRRARAWSARSAGTCRPTSSTSTPSSRPWRASTSNASLFATAETGDKGQFLDGDPSFVSTTSRSSTNLGLDFEVVVRGIRGGAAHRARHGVPERGAAADVLVDAALGERRSTTSRRSSCPRSTEQCADVARQRRRATATPATTRRTCCTRRSAPSWRRRTRGVRVPVGDELDRTTTRTAWRSRSRTARTPEEAAQEWVDANQDVWQPGSPAA